MQNLQIKRNELKYYISTPQCYLLSTRLKHILKRDSYATSSDGYFVRSLYFDSYDDECLYQKQSGNIYRSKYRMRIYNFDTQTVKFEIKNKANNQVYKESATISRESAYRIIEGDYDELLRYNNPILNKIYLKFTQKLYRPKVVVDYTREAYVYDHFNIRVTLDKNLHSNNTNYDIFNKNLHTTPVILEGKQILEIKYDSYLPEHIKAILQISSFERMAISKYTLSRRFLKYRNWEDN